MKNIKVKNGLKYLILMTFISSWRAQLFCFVQGHTKNFRDDNPGYLTALLLSATTHSPSAQLAEEHSGGIDFQQLTSSGVKLVKIKKTKNKNKNQDKQRKLLKNLWKWS